MIVILVLLLIFFIIPYILHSEGAWTNKLQTAFISVTMLTIGIISFFKLGSCDMQAMISVAGTLIPAVIVMSILATRIGSILDNPKSIADADYKIAVLNALKKMDKSMTLAQLNEKLTQNMEDQEENVEENNENSEEKQTPPEESP